MDSSSRVMVKKPKTKILKSKHHGNVSGDELVRGLDCVCTVQYSMCVSQRTFIHKFDIFHLTVTK